VGQITIDWWPQEKQKAFLNACGLGAPFVMRGEVAPPEQRVARVIGYGGAAGGGKGQALLGAALTAQLVHPGANVAIFRRTYPELEGMGGLILESIPIYNQLAKYQAQSHRWAFPGGGYIQFCHCQREEDVYRYQSWQMDYLFFDEATHFTEYQVRYLMTRNRATVDGVKPLCVLTTNPGNVGHLWYKKWFVDLGAWGGIHEYVPEDADDTAVIGEAETHLFIQALLSDNKILEERDPGYRMTLMRQDEDTRRALLYGDWDVFSGQVLKSWNKSIHVCKPFEIPASWLKWSAEDWGYAKPMAVLWFAQDPDTDVKYVYRELYKKGLTDPEQVDAIRGATASGEKLQISLADPSMWTKRTIERKSVSTAEVYEQMGLPLTRANNDRMAGLRSLQRHLMPDEGTGKPGIVFFDTCVNCIRTLPAIPHDKTNPEDADTDSEDHCYDAIRYGLLWKVLGGPRREPTNRRKGAGRGDYWGFKKRHGAARAQARREGD